MHSLDPMYLLFACALVTRPSYNVNPMGFFKEFALKIHELYKKTALYVTVYDSQGFNSLYSDCGLQSYLQGYILKDSDNSIVL
jgi:hypothetical protein